MAHGKCTAQIAGYVAKDITLDTSEKGGENYCRFRIGMHPRKSASQTTGEAEKKDDTVWLDCIAFGAVANALASAVKKGDYLTADTDLLFSENTKVKDGVTTVYKNVQFKIKAGFDFLTPVKKDSYTNPAPAPPAPANANPQGTQAYGSENYGSNFTPEMAPAPNDSGVQYTEEEQGLVDNQLPF